MGERTARNLLFRRKFIYGKELSNELQWRRVAARDGYSFLVHPDLEVTELKQAGNHFVLLGFLLDPENVSDGNEQVLLRLAECSNDIHTVADFLEDKSGRFALFCFFGQQEFVINDATGLRQVFYYQAPDGSVCVASLPSMISKRFGLEISEEARGYINSERYQKKAEPWWPGVSTPYGNVYHLLPNHYLDLIQMKSYRFWPNKKIKKYSLKTGTKLTGELFKKILSSLGNRYPLAISLSAGGDSRVMLAACKDFIDEITTFSMIYRKINENCDDISIPTEMTRQLGIHHKVINCNTTPSAEFSEVFYESSQDYKTDWLPIVQGRRNGIPSNRVIIKGSVAEVGLCSYWPDGVYPFRLTLRFILKKINLGDDPLISRYVKDWMVESLQVEEYGYKLLDIFSWENEAGNWQGMSHSIFDLAHEEYSPFSNRKLLSILLGVNSRFRCEPRYRIIKEIIKYLWNELTLFPINPSKTFSRKRFFDGEVLNKLRWVKYLFSKDKYDKLEK